LVLRLLTQTFNHTEANPGILYSFVVGALFILEPCFWLNWKRYEVIHGFLAEVEISAKMKQDYTMLVK
jgi:hypothetical protein